MFVFRFWQTIWRVSTQTTNRQPYPGPGPDATGRAVWDCHVYRVCRHPDDPKRPGGQNRHGQPGKGVANGERGVKNQLPKLLGYPVNVPLILEIKPLLPNIARIINCKLKLPEWPSFVQCSKKCVLYFRICQLFSKVHHDPK